MKRVRIIWGFAVLLTLGFSGCKDKNDTEDTKGEFDRSAMLKNYSTQLILPNYQALENSMLDLNKKTIAFTNDPTTTTLADVRASLFEAQMSYQACSSFEFGPANSRTLRAILSTYPTNESMINTNISSGSYNLYSAGNIAAKGFSAIDYLLFDVQKTDQEIIDLFTVTLNFVNRKAYLLAVVEQSFDVVKLVNKEWVSEGYQSVFESSNGVAVGSSVSLMLNAMVLDFERFIRDGKIGIPAGVRTLGVPLPEKVEAYYSQKSLDLVKESVTRYKNVFNGVTTTGENKQGFDDYLKQEDSAPVSDKINTQLDFILAELQKLNGPLVIDVVNNKEQVKKVYEELQKTILLLKVEMPSALSVLITYQDSDGD